MEACLLQKHPHACELGINDRYNCHSKCPWLMNTTRPLKFCLNSTYCSFSVLLVWCLCHWCLYDLIFMVFLSLKKILFLYCLIRSSSFSVTNIIFLNNSTKYNHMHSWNNLYEKHNTDWRNNKRVFQSFSPFHSIHICFWVCPASHTLGIRGCFTDRAV